MVKQASLQRNRLRRYLGLLVLPTPGSIARPGPG